LFCASTTRILRRTALFLAAAAIGAHSQSVPKTTSGYRIAGTVVNAASGEPVRRATVSVLSDEPNGQTIESVETDNDGRFSLEGLPAAKYPLTASKRGFLTAFYDQHEGYNTAIVTGADQDTSGLVFRLTPGAALRGVVTADGGDPVEGAKVMLFLKPHGHNPGERIKKVEDAATDDTGSYEFDDLAVGEYLLAVKADPWYAMHPYFTLGGIQQREAASSTLLDVAYPVTFFDAANDEASATPISLASGRRDEANINLRAVPALHLTLETPTKEDGRVAEVNLRQTIFGTEIHQDLLRVNNTVEFTGVAPGHYELTQGDPPRVAELDATTSQQVDPSLGTPTVAVSGSLQSSNGSALQGTLAIILSSLEDKPHAPLQTQCNNGIFSFTAVPPGAWELILDSNSKSLPIAAITIGNRTRAGSKINVRDKSIQLVATVSQSATRVEGFTRNKDGKGQPGVMIVMVPKEMAAFLSLARRDQSDSDGSFSLRDVAPGQYTVVAIQDGWELDWGRPEVIGRYLSRGVAVTVTESSGKLLKLSEAVPVQSR
jgi:5-hydroxyisourate hydrolase-like protein (transthyretin family)